jgi:hypothetical protein
MTDSLNSIKVKRIVRLTEEVYNKDSFYVINTSDAGGRRQKGDVSMEFIDENNTVYTFHYTNYVFTY